MAKTIKFNLTCDGKPIRTLEDLRNNFSVEDVLSYYQNGLLQRWLDVRGFTDELNAVNAISSRDEIEIIKSLVKIFAITSDIQKIEQDTYIFTYSKQRQEWLRKYEALKNNEAMIIRHYHEGFEALIDRILDNKDNMPLIKAALQEIEANYFELFYTASSYVIWLFASKAPMAFYALMMNETLRKCYLPDYEKNNIRRNCKPDNNISNGDLAGVKLPDASDLTQTQEILGSNLKTFAGQTEGYWKDIEPRGKKFMILHMESGNFVRASGLTGRDLSADDVNYEFVILDGIDYKSNSKTDKLIYLEV